MNLQVLITDLTWRPQAYIDLFSKLEKVHSIGVLCLRSENSVNWFKNCCSIKRSIEETDILMDLPIGWKAIKQSEFFNWVRLWTRAIYHFQFKNERIKTHRIKKDLSRGTHTLSERSQGWHPCLPIANPMFLFIKTAATTLLRYSWNMLHHIGSKGTIWSILIHVFACQTTLQ